MYSASSQSRFRIKEKLTLPFVSPTKRHFLWASSAPPSFFVLFGDLAPVDYRLWGPVSLIQSNGGDITL